MKEEFNFDLERMQSAVEGEPIQIPKGMRGAELKAFLSRLTKDREEVLAKPSDMSVEEAFEKTFARYEETFKELSTK